MGTGEQRPNLRGTGEQRQYWGNMEHKKTNFRFLGNGGTSQFISGEQGNRYPLPERASVMFSPLWPIVFFFSKATNDYHASPIVELLG